MLALPGGGAVWEAAPVTQQLVLEVTFETAKDYDITSAYAVRGWNTTEGHMVMVCPSVAASHTGKAGLEVRIDRAFDTNFHAQFSLPRLTARKEHSAYQLTFWARTSGGAEVQPEVSFLDVDEGYDWIGGAQVALSGSWQHIAMAPVATGPQHRGHEIQVAFLIGEVATQFFFDDIELYELDVPSPPPPSPPPPPSYLLWLDGEGGPKGIQVVQKPGVAGALSADLSSPRAAHAGVYGFEVTVARAFDEAFFGMLSLPAFFVADDERLYTLSFWARATGAPPPRVQVAFQDEDDGYAWIDGEHVQLRDAWHEHRISLAVSNARLGHNVVTNLMLGSGVGEYFFDDFTVSNKELVTPPPAPPAPPPAPPPNVLMQYTFEAYERGSINSQAWPEGDMQVEVQAPAAAHRGKFGIQVTVARRFETDWHAQVAFRPFTVSDTLHGYVLSFWARSGGDGAPPPKVGFHDADDDYTPLKTVPVPVTAAWNMYQVDLSIPAYRRGHSIVVAFWFGEAQGAYAVDDLEVRMVKGFVPPPPPPPLGHAAHGAPPPPGVVALLGFEGTADGVASQELARNGSWLVSVPDSRAAHSGTQGLYVEVTKPWRVASLAQLLLPPYVPRAGQETLLHLSFYARVDKMRSTDANPTVTLAFVDLDRNGEQLGAEVLTLTSYWQMHYAVIDVKTAHVGHAIRPYFCLGLHGGVFYFDDIEYKEIEIEDGDAWLQRAPERIRRERMGKYRITFLDEDDWPIDYGEASVSLERHAFPLGVPLRTHRMSRDDELWYLDTAARHFWAGSIEEQLLWSEYEPQPNHINDSRRSVQELLAWAEANRWEHLAASLFDSGHLPSAHWPNQLACKDLQNRLHERLLRDLQQFSGRIERYEVWRGALASPEWTERCGEDLLFNAFRWARQADARATLCSSEAGVLNTLTLTSAEAYHNLVAHLAAKDVPVGALGVQARFDGAVDASTVKQRLDMLHELRLPVYVTDFSISGVSPSQHAYELEKFMRIAFSHEAVAGISLGNLWDKDNAFPGSGLFAENKQPKPAAAKVQELWEREWYSDGTTPLASEGSVYLEAFHGRYLYDLSSGDLSCTGELDLTKRERPSDDPQQLVVRCAWRRFFHVPVWVTPVVIAALSVLLLFFIWRARASTYRALPRASTEMTAAGARYTPP